MARKNEIVIIGAGTFGSSVASKIAEISKYTVIVIDNNMKKVDALATVVDAGFIGNATEEAFIDSIGLQNAGVFIIGIGENIQDSIMVTSLIKRKFPEARIIAKASNPNHAQVLESLEANDVIQPEITAARRAVIKIINPQLSKGIQESLVQEMDGGLSLIRVPAPEEMWGKKVKDIDLPVGTQINVIYKSKVPSIVTGNTEIKKNNDLVLIGKTKIVYKIASEMTKKR